MPNSDDAIRKVLRPDARLSDLCRHVSGKTSKPPVKRTAAEAPRARKPKLPTYKAAREALLGSFLAAGWDLSSPHLNVPHVTSESGQIRFWLKPQAVYISRGTHTMNTARNTGIDMRQPGAFEKLLATYAKSQDVLRHKSVPSQPKSSTPSTSNGNSLERQIVSLLKKAGPQMTIVDVRQRFPGKSPSELNSALKSLFRRNVVVLYPEDDSRTLSLNPFMQMGRLVIHGEPKHWVRLQAGPGRPDLFSRQVLKAVKNAPSSARFGPGKVFISEAFKTYKQDPQSPPVSSLADFKKILAHANQRGELSLMRADLVGAMDPEKVRASEMRHLNAEFHFIIDPRYP